MDELDWWKLPQSTGKCFRDFRDTSRRDTNYLVQSDTSEMTSTEAKERGAAAWVAQDFKEAVIHFSTAIEIGGDKDFLKVFRCAISPQALYFQQVWSINKYYILQVVYSNRSAANLKLNKLKEALADASKCIDLDRNWSKGFTRKGDALFSQVKYSEALDSYNSAKALSPNDELIMAKCELTRKAIRTEADIKSGASSAGSGSTSVAAAKPLDKFINFFRYLLLLSGILYIIPLGKNYSLICFR